MSILGSIIALCEHTSDLIVNMRVLRVSFYDVKYTTRNPTQLPTTPTAEYELVNISGKNSYFFPNTT
jgi:hypothetical protein